MKIETHALSPLLDEVQRRGGDTTPLLARFRLSSDARQRAHVSIKIATLRRLFEAAEQMVADASIGVHAANNALSAHAGVVTAGAIHARNLSEYLEDLVRFSSLVSLDARLHLERSEQTVKLSHTYPEDPGGLGRQGNEYTVVSWLALVRQVTGTRVVPRRAWFAHQGAASIELLEALGTQAVEFGQPTNGIEFDLAQLELPVVPSQAELDRVRDQAVGELSTLPRSSEYLSALHGHLRRAMHLGSPRLVDMAKVMCTSDRTMQRRLDESGTTFQQLLDDVRRAVAMYHLDRHATFAEIAFTLGYGEMSSFLRAFKRWTGVRPSALRKAGGPRALDSLLAQRQGAAFPPETPSASELSMAPGKLRAAAQS